LALPLRGGSCALLAARLCLRGYGGQGADEENDHYCDTYRNGFPLNGHDGLLYLFVRIVAHRDHNRVPIREFHGFEKPQRTAVYRREAVHRDLIPNVQGVRSS
jgi:hypothetical protein